jgi:tetratricopeptide (TPR) repeat protein
MNIDNSSGAAHKEDFEYLGELNKKLETMPYNYDTLLRKALLLYYPFYRSDQAEQVFVMLAELYPDKYDTYFWHGESLYVCDGHHEKAIQLLRKAISVDKNRADGYVLLAQTLNMMDDSYQQEMECLLKEALKLEPRWPNTWYGLISLFITQNRFDEARQMIEEAFHHIPLSYTHSDDIIQGRHDELVSGRSWTPCMKDDLQEYLQSIKIEEAKIKKLNEYSS